MAQNFTAKVQVNFIANMKDLPEFEARVSQFVDANNKQEQSYNKQYVTPQFLIDSILLKDFMVNDIILIGDKIEFMESNPLSMAVKVYPKSFFEKYSKRMVPMFNQSFGNVNRTFGNLQNYDPDTREFILKNKDKNTKATNEMAVLVAC
jgi:hypothetical protein